MVTLPTVATSISIGRHYRGEGTREISVDWKLGGELQGVRGFIP